MDTNSGQNQISDDKSLFTVIDRFCLSLVKQNCQQDIAYIEKQDGVSVSIIEDYGQVLIKRANGETKGTEEDKELFQQVGYKFLQLCSIQSNKLKEGKIDCNAEFYHKVEKRLKRSYQELNKKQDYELELITNDIDQNSYSANNYKPLVLKSFNIKGKFVVKICKIEQPEALNFDKIDVLVLNMTNARVFLDEYGYALSKSNKQINTLIKSLKKDISSAKFIDEKVFTIGNKNISLLIQLEEDEESCIKRLTYILDKLNDQKFQQKGNLRIYIGWRQSCGQRYFDALYKYLEGYESKKTYLQFPTEICLVTDEGLENQHLQVAQTVQFNRTVVGKVETQKLIIWNINSVKYPRFVEQTTELPGAVLNKEVTDIIEKAIEQKIEEFYVAFKPDAKECQFFQSSKELGMNPDIVDRMKLNLKTLKETNLSQSYTNQIMNQCDFYYYYHPFDEDFKQYEDQVQNVIRSYVQLGLQELRLEKDSCSMEVITPIFKINIKALTMQQCQGKKNIVYMKRQQREIQVMTSEQKQAYDDIMKTNVLEFLQSDLADKVQNLTQKSKPMIQIRARPNVYDEIESFIHQLKLSSFVTHQIKINKEAINKAVREFIQDTNLRESVEISLLDDFALIYGYKKTLNRILPAIMNQICENKLAEESVYTIPMFWEPQNQNHKLVALDINSQEAVKCVQMFAQTMKSNIRQVYRIQNINLWKSYQFEKETLLQKGNASEKLLFHGPGKNVNPESIYSAMEEGFDFRNDQNQANNTTYNYNAQSGGSGIFGRGGHFNDEASTADLTAFCGGNKKILIASVLLGKSFVASSNQYYTKPPLIKEGTEQRYDSVKSNYAEGKNTYAVYHNSKAYPYYLIEYN